MLHVWTGAAVALTLALMAVPRVRAVSPLPLAAFAVYLGTWVGAQLGLPTTALAGLTAVGGLAFGVVALAAGGWLVALVAWVTSLLVDAPSKKATLRGVAIRTGLVPFLYLLTVGETAVLVRTFVYVWAPGLLEAPPALH